MLTVSYQSVLLDRLPSKTNMSPVLSSCGYIVSLECSVKKLTCFARDAVCKEASYVIVNTKQKTQAAVHPWNTMECSQLAAWSTNRCLLMASCFKAFH